LFILPDSCAVLLNSQSHTANTPHCCIKRPVGHFTKTRRLQKSVCGWRQPFQCPPSKLSRYRLSHRLFLQITMLHPKRHTPPNSSRNASLRRGLLQRPNLLQPCRPILTSPFQIRKRRTSRLLQKAAYFLASPPTLAICPTRPCRVRNRHRLTHSMDPSVKLSMAHNVLRGH
jgi:hypothetical protein